MPTPKQRPQNWNVVEQEGCGPPQQGVSKPAKIHRGRGRDTHRGIHGRDRHQIGGYVLLDLLRDVDGLSLVAELRQDFDDASKENVARLPKENRAPRRS